MAENRMAVLEYVRNQLVETDADLVRELLSLVVQELMSADADAQCGAPYRERTEGRENHRNGYRTRRWDTRVGSIELRIPKLRKGSYYPAWLLDARKRSERALVQVVAESYVRGVSTRRVDGLVKSMGIDGISSSQVSEMAKSLDAAVESFRSRPLDGGPYTYLWLDAMFMRTREQGRIVNTALAVATAVNADGHREILGLDLFTSEDGAAWTAFLRDLVARGLQGVQLVTSDAHPGLKDAVAAVLPGSSWQRCRTHFMRNLLTRVAKHAQSVVASLIRTIFVQPDTQQVEIQHSRVVEQLEDQFSDAARLLSDAFEDLLAFRNFPKEHWKQIWSNNPQERLNKEIRRRSDVVGIFPCRASIIRLIGAVLMEQNDEWAVARRYMGVEALTKARMSVVVGNAPLPNGEEVKQLAEVS